MAFKFPWSNLHELNLDWILSVVKRFSELVPPMETAVEDVQALQGDVAQAVEDAQTAVTSANQAAETAAEALEVAEQAAAGTIADGAVITSKLADGAVTNDKIAAGAVTASKLGPGAVQTLNIANGAVTTDKIENGTIIAEDMADNAVSTAKIADDAVTNAKLADNAVNTAEIAAGAVTTAKIADDAVTKIKIADEVFEDVLQYHSSPAISTAQWTAPYCGFCLAVVTWNTSTSPAYWYIKDISDNNRRTCALSTQTANGFSESTMFPIIKGHTYTTDAITNTDSAIISFYRFS